MYDICKILLTRGANPNHNNKAGINPGIIARINEQKKIEALLIRHGGYPLGGISETLLAGSVF